jgi:GT2 family glycosyltransferase
VRAGKSNCAGHVKRTFEAAASGEGGEVRESNEVAVMVLNWNGREHLETCLRALAAQTWQRFELVIIDNGSTDDSLPWLARQTIAPLRIIATGENLGFAGGNTEGLRHLSSQVEYVVLLNNDTAPEPGWLAALVEAAQVDSRRGVVASLILDWPAEFIDSAGIALRVTGRGYQRFRGYPSSTTLLSGPVFGASAAAALYRRTTAISRLPFLDHFAFGPGVRSECCCCAVPAYYGERGRFP